MTAAEPFYVAWDGSRYTGIPPDGWYLAVDNRWWPPQDIIDGGATRTDDPPSANAPESDQPSESRPPTPSDRPRPPATAVRPEWAPISADGPNRGESQGPEGAPGPPDPGVPGGPSGGQVGPRRRASGQGRRHRIRPGFLIPILIFVLFRCAAESDQSSAPDFQPSATVVSTIPPTVSATTEDPGSFTVERDGLELAITGCGPTSITGQVRNVGDRTASFEAEISVLAANDEASGAAIDSTVVVPVRTLIPSESQSFNRMLPDEISEPIACEFVAATTVIE